jgi:hypothetical protein
MGALAVVKAFDVIEDWGCIERADSEIESFG